MEPIQFGASVRQLRQQLGLTQRQLAHEVAGYLSEKDIAQIESGRRGLLSPERLEPLLIALGSDMGSFLHPRHHGPHTNAVRPMAQPDRTADLDLQDALERLRVARQACASVCLETARLMSQSRGLIGI